MRINEISRKLEILCYSRLPEIQQNELSVFVQVIQPNWFFMQHITGNTEGFIEIGAVTLIRVF